MGIYIVSKEELIEKLTDCLDNVEGDFNSENLLEALEFMKYYAPTSDTSKAFEKMWNKKLDKLYDK